MNRTLSTIVIFLTLSITCQGQIKNNASESDKSPAYPAILFLRNGGYSFLDLSFTRLQVKGVVHILNDRLIFIPDSIFNSHSAGKVFRYNHLIKSFDLHYSDIKMIKLGSFFAGFVPIRVPTIITKNGMKYRISLAKPKTFIKEVKSRLSLVY